jgi:hypothetical protein
MHQINSTLTLPDGSVSLAKLSATGTKDATTFLRGDNTFADVQATTKGDGGSMLTASVTLQVTTNNSSYTTRAEGITELLDNGHGQHYFGTLVDVTDISNIKIRLGISTNANEVVLQGSTDSSKTAIFFTKLGDT